jgi:hypothetical protein
MPAGKIEEITDGSGWFKIRTDYDTHTLYEVQNRSKTKVEACFAFHGLKNIRLDVQGTAKQADDVTFGVVVPPGETLPVVAVFTADPDDAKWNFDYKLSAKVSEEPEWL